MSSNLKKDIAGNISEIDKLFETYDLLFSLVRQQTPDAIELAALATVLHSFYNGVENTFLHITKTLGDPLPSGMQWHRDLLLSMGKDTPNRARILSDDLILQLGEYMQFRHFFRHAYSFSLSWERMKPLVDRLESVWSVTKTVLSKI